MLLLFEYPAAASAYTSDSVDSGDQIAMKETHKRFKNSPTINLLLNTDGFEDIETRLRGGHDHAGHLRMPSHFLNVFLALAQCERSHRKKKK
jgi:hypothetical protein